MYVPDERPAGRHELVIERLPAEMGAHDEQVDRDTRDQLRDLGQQPVAERPAGQHHAERQTVDAARRHRQR